MHRVNDKLLIGDADRLIYTEAEVEMLRQDAEDERRRMQIIPIIAGLAGVLACIGLLVYIVRAL